VEGRRVERVCEILGSLKLCRARVTKEGPRVRERYTKPMRGDLREKAQRLVTLTQKRESKAEG